MDYPEDSQRSYHYKVGNQTVILKVRINPGAKNNQIVGLMDDGSVKIKIKAKPVEGKANKGLVDFLSDILNMKKTKIKIISGFTSRNKRLEIAGLDENSLRKMLAAYIIYEP